MGYTFWLKFSIKLIRTQLILITFVILNFPLSRYNFDFSLLISQKGSHIILLVYIKTAFFFKGLQIDVETINCLSVSNLMEVDAIVLLMQAYYISLRKTKYIFSLSLLRKDYTVAVEKESLLITVIKLILFELSQDSTTNNNSFRS